MQTVRLTASTRRWSLRAGLALAVLAIALSASALLTTSVAIKTGGSLGCYTSGTGGDLVTDPDSGVAIIESSGRRLAVTWPVGWTGRRSWTDVEILDAHGGVQMRTGTNVYLMGGYWYVDGSFLTCGGHTN